MGVSLNKGTGDKGFGDFLNFTTDMPCLRRGVRMGDINADGVYLLITVLSTIAFR
jgi:hypothetical protein